MGEVEDVVIVGGGIAGLATAVALRRVGVGALVLERSEELRATGGGLNLFPNAWLALNALGVAHKLNSIYAPCNKGFITNVCSGTTQEISTAGSVGGGAGPTMVHRKALLEALAEELPIPAIRFSSKLTSIEAPKLKGSSNVILHMEDGTIIKTKMLIGCDGVHSVVARWLGLGKPVNCGRLAVRGLAVFPKGHTFSHELHHFQDIGRKGAFIPLSDKELYWFLLTSNSISEGEGMIDGNPETIQREVIENFAKDFPPMYLDVVRHSDLSTLTLAPLMLRLPWHIMFGNLCNETITVAGDAMHPMTPDIGQGGCSALEDAVVLGRHIGESFLRYGEIVPREAAKAIDKYVEERRWRAVGLVTGSYLAGWVQQDGLAWWKRWFRDVIFYRFLYHRVFNATMYDCGELPKISSTSELEKQSKFD